VLSSPCWWLRSTSTAGNDLVFGMTEAFYDSLFSNMQDAIKASNPVADTRWLLLKKVIREADALVKQYGDGANDELVPLKDALRMFRKECERQ